MPFNELELKRIDHTVGGLCRRKTRPEHAEQLRFECEIDGHTVSVWEVRPPWDGVATTRAWASPASATSALEACGFCTGCAETSNGTAMTQPPRLPILLRS